MSLSKLFTGKICPGVSEAARNLAKLERDRMCTCSRQSLDPVHHAEDCGYRMFWRKAAAELRKEYPGS